MPTQNEKSIENFSCLEESEISDKTGKINLFWEVYPVFWICFQTHTLDY